MMNSKKVEVYESGVLYVEHTGNHIILSVADYNSIVRQLNLLKLLMREALPQSARDNNPIYDKLFSTNNEVVE